MIATTAASLAGFTPGFTLSTTRGNSTSAEKAPLGMIVLSSLERYTTKLASSGAPQASFLELQILTVEI